MLVNEIELKQQWSAFAIETAQSPTFKFEVPDDDQHYWYATPHDLLKLTKENNKEDPLTTSSQNDFDHIKLLQMFAHSEFDIDKISKPAIERVCNTAYLMSKEHFDKETKPKWSDSNCSLFKLHKQNQNLEKLLTKQKSNLL